MPNTRNLAKFELAFERGETQELTLLNSQEANARGVLHLAILANALFGEFEMALWHHRWALDHKIKFEESQAATVDFAMGVGHTRISEYAKARTFFARNARFRRAGPRARFFLWQGLGFYRYFTGNFVKSSGFARRALETAAQSKFAYGELISEELLAHSLTEAGEVRLGMKHMSRALKRARVLEHKSLRQSFRLMLLLNEARFGLNWDCVPLLSRALEKLHPRDTYSRNAVKLELANQWMLRGLADQAFAVLDEACDSIYASQNRRQIAQLNFRLAFLTWLRGRRDEALHLLKSAELHLHKEVDVALWKRMRGLRERIVHAGPNANAPGPAGRVFGEDRIHDLYQIVRAKDPKALDTILEQRLHFFLYPYFNLAFEQKGLLFDLLPRGVIVVDRGNIAVVERGFSRVNRRILEALATSHQSKAELIEGVWGYKYESERHDPLVYTSISKIRQLLGAAGAWIEVDEKGYRLQSGVRLQTQDIMLQDLPARVARPKLAPLPEHSTLNFRQLRIIAALDLANRDMLGVDEIMRDFAISRATATRDLSELTDLGLLKRIGRARATKYALAPQELKQTHK